MTTNSIINTPIKTKIKILKKENQKDDDRKIRKIFKNSKSS